MVDSRESGLLFFMFIRAQPYTCLGIGCLACAGAPPAPPPPAIAAFIRRISPGLGSALPTAGRASGPTAAPAGAAPASPEGAGGALPDDVASPRLQPPMGTSYPSQLDGSNGSYAEPPRIGAVLGAPRPPRPPLPWPFPVRRSYGVGRLVGTSWTVTAFRYPGPTTLGL